MVRCLRDHRTLWDSGSVWRNTPNQADAPTGLHRLIDLGIEAAALLSEIDSLPENQQASLLLLDQLQEHLDSLTRWERSCGLLTRSSPSRHLSMSPRDTVLRSFPRRVSDLNNALYHDIHDVRLMCICWTIKLTIVMAIMDRTYMGMQFDDIGVSASKWQHVDDSTGETISILAMEAFLAAEGIVTHVDIDQRNLWPSYGDMIEVWMFETVERWYTDFAPNLTSLRRSSVEYSEDSQHAKREYCQALLRYVKLQMNSDSV